MTLTATIPCLHLGALRWDLGLENPNKAAILLACLLIPLLYGMLRARKAWLAFAFAALALPAGYAFLRTLSRGGFVAFAAGMAVVILAVLRDRLAGSRWLALLLIASLLSVGALWTGFAGRLAASRPSHDASVGNRLVIWRAVPTMMHDAPGGWGIGNAGSAFMGWYQPLSRHERYRTLVNSHFTWLAEFGWRGRFLYVSGWLLALILGVLHLIRRNDPLPLSLGLCLWTGSAFSSVAEAWYVWLIPAVAMLPAARTFVSAPARKKAFVLAGAAGGGMAIIGLFALCGGLFPVRTHALHLSPDGERLSVGKGNPTRWIVFDERTMGGKTYGRALRAFVDTPEAKGRAIGIAMRLAAVPDDARLLVLCGASAEDAAHKLGRFRELEELRVLSPSNPADWLASGERRIKTSVICGDLSANCPAHDVPGLKTVPGADDYLPSWPRLAFADP